LDAENQPTNQTNKKPSKSGMKEIIMTDFAEIKRI
jgi:hypothetical protein